MFQDSQDSSCSSDIVGARIEFESSEIAGGFAFNRVFLSSGDFGVVSRFVFPACFRPDSPLKRLA
jgi:hypothetical protein